MERIRGLEEYVKNKEYREALGLPKRRRKITNCWHRESIILIMHLHIL